MKKKLDRNNNYLIDYILAKLRGTKIEWVLKYIQIRANFLFVLIKKKTFQKQLEGEQKKSTQTFSGLEAIS